MESQSNTPLVTRTSPSINKYIKERPVTANNLTSKYSPQDIATESNTYINAAPNITNLGLKIIQAQKNNDNVLISPMSVAHSLAMIMNGADGNTLTQIERIFGCTKEEINEFLYEYSKRLPANAENGKPYMANSIWIKDNGNGLAIKDEFLQTTSNYYRANVYSDKFDGSTLDNINNWVRNNTNNMIDGILDKIPEDAIMYLINAIAFGAKWATPYIDYDIVSSFFTSKSGDVQAADFMLSTEDKYIATENAKGFIKDYENGYSFVALLPNEDIEMDNYIKSLTGESLYKMLMSTKNRKIACALPKFSSDYSIELSESLKKIGITDLLDSNLANLNNMAHFSNENLSVSRVLHKTHVDIDERGVRAATTMATETRIVTGLSEKWEEVVLDRPFVYMLVDTGSMIPLFIGIMNNI